MSSEEEGEIEPVSLIIIGAHRNMRGKDFKRKNNSHKGASYTETTHTPLCTADYINSLKKDKWTKEETDKRGERRHPRNKGKKNHPRRKETMHHQ